MTGAAGGMLTRRIVFTKSPVFSKGVPVMLVLSRKQNEEILVGDNVCIKVVGIFGNKVRLGISAPAHVVIRRGELDFLERTSDCLPNPNNRATVDIDMWPRGDCLLEHA